MKEEKIKLLDEHSMTQVVGGASCTINGQVDEKCWIKFTELRNPEYAKIGPSKPKRRIKR